MLRVCGSIGCVLGHERVDMQANTYLWTRDQHLHHLRQTRHYNQLQNCPPYENTIRMIHAEIVVEVDSPMEEGIHISP